MELDMLGVSVISGARGLGLEPLRGLEKAPSLKYAHKPIGCTLHACGCM